MTYRQLVEHKNAIKAKRVILTHMGDDMLALEHCEFERASDGLEIRL
jgi:hypothetical protein